MDELISDAVSIFMQVLMQFAPDRINTFEFQLTGYIFASAFILLMCWVMFKLLASFGQAVINWLNKGW